MRVDGPSDEVVTAVEEALTADGVAVLSDTAESGTFEKTLDRTVRDSRYGAGNPSLAAEAIEAELSRGALLPWSVIVSAAGDGGRRRGRRSRAAGGSGRESGS